MELGFLGSSMGKNLLANAGNVGLAPGSGRFLGGGIMATHFSIHGQRSLMGYSPWGFKESDTAEHACTRALHLILINGKVCMRLR